MHSVTRAYLGIIACGLLPAIVVAISMFVIHNLFIAMFLMHWIAMVPIIVGVSLLLHGPSGLRWYWLYAKQQEFRQVAGYLVVVFVLGTMAVIGGYILSSCKSHEWELCIAKVDDNIAEYGFKDAPTWLVGICAVYFPCVNPIIEELFWRVFFHREIELAQEPADSQDSEERSILVDETGQSLSQESLHLEKAASGAITTDKRVIFSMLYASYHTMVVGVFLGGVQYGAFSFFLVALLGYLLQEIIIRGNPKHGFNMALALHIGVDLGVVVALGDAIGWYDLV